MTTKAEIKCIWEEMMFLSIDVFFDLLLYVFQNRTIIWFLIKIIKKKNYRQFNKIVVYNKQDATKKDSKEETNASMQTTS